MQPDVRLTSKTLESDSDMDSLIDLVISNTQIRRTKKVRCYMFLNMECGRCRVSSTCPRVGQSPLKVGGKTLMCRIVGGYGRTPADPSILSEESAKRAEKDGPCLTLAEIPVIEEDGTVMVVIERIFSQPILHEREKTDFQMDIMYPKSHLLSVFAYRIRPYGLAPRHQLREDSFGP